MEEENKNNNLNNEKYENEFTKFADKLRENTNNLSKSFEENNSESF